RYHGFFGRTGPAGLFPHPPLRFPQAVNPFHPAAAVTFRPVWRTGSERPIRFARAQTALRSRSVEVGPANRFVAAPASSWRNRGSGGPTAALRLTSLKHSTVEALLRRLRRRSKRISVSSA